MEPIASPETHEQIRIEDIVVSYKDGHKVSIQAKKNQPDHRAWSLSGIKDIVSDTKKQLKKDPTGYVHV